jgi:hypothetical protein
MEVFCRGTVRIRCEPRCEALEPKVKNRLCYDGCPKAERDIWPARSEILDRSPAHANVGPFRDNNVDGWRG